MTARDLRYGRRAGRWASDVSGNVAGIRAEFEKLRRDPSVEWPDPTSPGPARPDTADEWNGRARLARARSEAGLDLSDLDVEALERVPNPTSAFFPGELFGARTPGSSSSSREPSPRPDRSSVADGPAGS